MDGDNKKWGYGYEYGDKNGIEITYYLYKHIYITLSIISIIIYIT